MSDTFYIVDWAIESGEDHNLPNAVRVADESDILDQIEELHGVPANGVRRVEFDIDEFIDGYIDAILWIDCQNPCETCEGYGNVEKDIHADRSTCPDCDGGSHESGGGESLTLTPGTRFTIVQNGQLVEFVEHYLIDLLAYVEACNTGVREGYAAHEGTPESYAGHDLYLTRAHHGAGFWDRGLGDLGKRLTDAADAHGSVDDHMVYNNNDGTASA